jgi:hypothetical protein
MRTSYEEKILSMRETQDRQRSEIERLMWEKSDLEKLKTELQAHHMLAQSRVRENESAVSRSEREVERLSGELAQMREQLRQKDTDLRDALLSLSDFHRTGAEEKAALRAEAM